VREAEGKLMNLTRRKFFSAPLAVPGIVAAAAAPVLASGGIVKSGKPVLFGAPMERITYSSYDPGKIEVRGVMGNLEIQKMVREGVRAGLSRHREMKQRNG
jgi:hypothetical protein